MSLEILTHKLPEKQESNLTPEAIEALEIGYENEVGKLRGRNLKYLIKADKIKAVDERKKIIMRLGWISVEAAKANEELKKELN